MLPQTQGETITTTAKTGQVRSLEWTGSRLRVLDQRLLPTRVEYVELERWQDVVSAIQSMQVRGAPAIGVAGAYGVVLAARALCDFAVPAFREELAVAAEQLAAARPTAVNLPWAVARTLRAADGAADTLPTPSSGRFEKHRRLKPRTCRRTWPSARTVRRCCLRAREF